MGRTLPPLFRTVRRVVRILLTRTLRRFLRRVWQNSAKGRTSGRILLKVGLLQNSVKVQNLRVLQNSVKGSIFVLQISVKQKRTFLLNSAKTFIFCLADFCGTKLRGWLWLSFGYIPPFRLRISFDVLLLACKGVRLALILLLRVCRVKRADVAIISPYSTLQSLYSF